MQLPNQIENISIACVANAAHYEYLATVLKRTEEIRLENELWRKAVEEFRSVPLSKRRMLLSVLADVLVVSDLHPMHFNIRICIR